jgi:hypothetical protein
MFAFRSGFDMVFPLASLVSFSPSEFQVQNKILILIYINAIFRPFSPVSNIQNGVAMICFATRSQNSGKITKFALI